MNLDPVSKSRLFDWHEALAHPVTSGVVFSLVGLIFLAFVIIFALRGLKKINAETFQELKARTLTWAWLTPLMIVPILAGAAWTMLGILVVSVLCYREMHGRPGCFGTM